MFDEVGFSGFVHDMDISNSSIPSCSRVKHDVIENQYDKTKQNSWFNSLTVDWVDDVLDIYSKGEIKEETPHVDDTSRIILEIKEQ